MELVSSRDRLPVTARLQYTSRDPWAVSMVFAADRCAPVVWVFARDLLVDGMRSLTGVGDVRIFPAGDSVVLDLASPDGSARLVASAADLAAFVSETASVVPSGREVDFVDIAAEMAMLCEESFVEWGDA